MKPQKKNNERINLYVDDRFFCGLAIDDLVKNNLTTGMDVSEEFLSKLLLSSGENNMYAKTLAYILHSPRTETEIKRFLSHKKDCSAEITERIITRLKTMNYINDEAYAKMFTAHKHSKSSARAIKQKLKQKGVDAEFIDMATKNIDNQDALAHTVATKYMRNKEYDQKNLQKLFRYLVTKGFEYNTVVPIVEEYKAKNSLEHDEFDSCKDEYIRARKELKSAKKKYKTVKRKM